MHCKKMCNSHIVCSRLYTYPTNSLVAQSNYIQIPFSKRKRTIYYVPSSKGFVLQLSDKPLISNLPPCLPLQPLKSRAPSCESVFERGGDYLSNHKSKRFTIKQSQSYYLWTVCVLDQLGVLGCPSMCE